MRIVDYAQKQIQITAEENGIQNVTVLNGRLYIEFPSGRNYELSEEEIFEGDLYLMRNHEGQIKAYEVGHRKVYINTEDEHFECLNRTNAEKRVEKFKKGLIKDLNNLQKPKNKTINLY